MLGGWQSALVEELGDEQGMSGYKGYTYRDTDKKVVSPLGEPIATFLRYLSDGVWFDTHIQGMEAGGYKTIDEAVRHLADQHRALTGADDGDLTIAAGEARGIIIGTVKNLAALANLRVLDVSGNRLAELSPLAELERLRELHVGGNLIEDFSPLAERAGLRVFGAEDQHWGD